LKAGWRFRQAETALARGKFAEAAGLYESACTAADSPQSRMKHGFALWESGSRKEGLALAEGAGNTLPDSHPARLYLALLLAEEGRAADARKLLEAVQARDPENLFAKGVSALILLSEDRGKEASSLLKPGVFGSVFFRTHLLLALERHLKRRLNANDWTEAYLETVL
jgi:tetratricopeptide (TPR) repeat protein